MTTRLDPIAEVSPRAERSEAPPVQVKPQVASVPDSISSSEEGNACYGLCSCFTYFFSWICSCFSSIFGKGEEKEKVAGKAAEPKAAAAPKRSGQRKARLVREHVEKKKIENQNEELVKIKADGKALLNFQTIYYPDGKDSLVVDKQKFIADFQKLPDWAVKKMRKAIWKVQAEDILKKMPADVSKEARHQYIDAFIQEHPTHLHFYKALDDTIVEQMAKVQAKK